MDTAIEKMIASVEGRPKAMINLARSLLLPKGHDLEARELVQRALALSPDDPELLASSNLVRARGIGSWYFTMVQDHGRHVLYDKALRALITPGCRVLDIGAGTGLFAMMAARAGAAEVIACEADTSVAEIARQTIERNGLSHIVKIIPKRSTDLEIGVDMDEPADVLLWDNLANNLLGQFALPVLEDARRRLVKPAAPVIPAAAEIRVATIEDRTPENRLMYDCEGFDLSAFNFFSPTGFTMSMKNMVRRSSSATLFAFDFNSDTLYGPADGEVEVVSKGGHVNGIAQWVRFHLVDGIVYDTGEETGVEAFGIEFHTATPRETTEGEKILIAGKHDRVSTWFWLK